MSTLSSQYLGLPLRSPIVAASSPKTGSVDRLCALEDAGIGAVVLPSLFAEQLESDHATELSALMGMPPVSESELVVYNNGPDAYLRLIRDAKAAVSVPVIASLNACTVGGWTHYSQLIQSAGADAIELNIYFLPTEPTISGAEIERRYCDIVRQVRCGVGIPMSVKVSPFFSSFPHMAAELYRAGAEGLVLFNRFLQPDIDLDQLAVRPRLWFSTSTRSAWRCGGSRSCAVGSPRVSPPPAVRTLPRTVSNCYWPVPTSCRSRRCCSSAESSALRASTAKSRSGSKRVSSRR